MIEGSGSEGVSLQLRGLDRKGISLQLRGLDWSGPAVLMSQCIDLLSNSPHRTVNLLQV